MDVLEALAAECRLISDTVLQLDEAAFARPTRCSAWNVKELLAHLYRDIEQVAVMTNEPPPEGGAEADGASYWGLYDPVSDGRSIADRAKMRAAAHRTGHELARIWDWMWPKALADAAAQPEGRVIATWGPRMLLREFLRTRVIEAAVHGLDLADALGREPWITAEASRIVRDVLEIRFGQPAPDRWDDLAFIEAGTGRRRLDAEDAAILGRAAARFPLLA